MSVLNINSKVVSLDVGKFKFLSPTANLKQLQFETSIGYNTVESRVGIDFKLPYTSYKMKFGLKGFVGGLSGTIKLRSFKNIEIGGSLGLGGAIYWDITE